MKRQKAKIGTTPRPAKAGLPPFIKGGIFLITILLISAKWCYGQDFDFGFDYWGKARGTGNFQSHIVSTTPQGIFPYDNFAAQFTPPMYAKAMHKAVLATAYTYLDLYFKMNYTSGQFIMGQEGFFVPAFRLYVENDSLKWTSRSTNRVLCKIGTGWHTYRLNLSGGTVNAYKDGAITKTYNSVTIDTMTDKTLNALVLGDEFQAVSEGRNNIYSNGGGLTATLDSIYFYCGTNSSSHDTLITVNFDNGAWMYSARQWFVWSNHTAHDFVTYNLSGGYVSMAYNNYFPDLVYVDGGRKDTCKYFTLMGGLREWTASGYLRAAVTGVETNPAGTYVMAIGGFNCLGDSATSISCGIAKWDGATWSNVGDTGMPATSFQYDGKWINDRYFAVSWLNTDRGFTIFDVVEDTCITKLVDTVIVRLGVMNNKLYYLDRSRLQEYDVATNTITTRAVFTETVQDLASNSAIECINDTVIVAAGSHIYWLNSSWQVFQTMDFNKWTGDVYSIGGIWRIKRTSDGHGGRRDWFVGDYKGINGVTITEGDYITYGAIGYVENGVYTMAGRIGGSSGDCNAYAPSCKKGAFTLMSTSVTEPYPGDYVITGTFRTVNDIYTGNIALYNSNGWRPLDYGAGFTVWKADTLNGNLYFAADAIEFGGLRMNHIAGRYLDSTFALVKPVMIFTPVGDMPSVQFPPTLDMSAYSPASRDVQVTVTQQVNYDGTPADFSMSKTDSNLSSSYGYWRYDRSGTFTGSVTTGDTVFYDIAAVDNLGNEKDTSLYFVIIPTVKPTASLTQSWLYTTLSDGAVSSWTNSVDTVTLRQGTSGARPTKSSTGITFDGGDWLYNLSVLDLPSDAYSVHWVMKFVDTSFTNPPLNQWPIMVRNDTRILNMMIMNAGYTANQRLQILMYNGTNWYNGKYYSLTSFKMNKYALYSITYDGTNTIKFYVNGVLKSGTTSNVSGTTDNGIIVGQNFTRFLSNGTGLRTIDIYAKENTQQEVTDLTNYFIEQGIVEP